MKAKRLNQAGIDLIKRFEGFSSTVYRDVAGYPTIGYGHLVLPGESWGSITEKEGEELLRADVKQFEKAVNENVSVPISQNMFNSLVSFAYNVGVNAFENSTLLKKLNGADYIGAANELERWNKAGGEVVAGLVNRRKIEQEVFFL
jgi:lysozyme